LLVRNDDCNAIFYALTDFVAADAPLLAIRFSSFGRLAFTSDNNDSISLPFDSNAIFVNK